MNELDLRERLKEQTDEDDSNFDYYATQFVTSLENLNDPEDSYWHGRLIGYDSPEQDTEAFEEDRKPKPYELVYLGEQLTEKVFRKLLSDKKLHIKSFKLTSKPNYEPDTITPKRGLDPHIVTYEAEILIAGEDKPRKFCLTHHIRRTYLAYRTEIKEC